MSRNNIQAYYHIVFRIKRELNAIEDHLHYELYGYIWDQILLLELVPIAINGTRDHIHVLLKTHSKITIAAIVQNIKGSSSRWLNINGNFLEPFSWKRGYGLFTVSPKDVDLIINYIKKQKEHHKSGMIQSDWEVI